MSMCSTSYHSNVCIGKGGTVYSIVKWQKFIVSYHLLFLFDFVAGEAPPELPSLDSR